MSRHVQEGIVEASQEPWATELRGIHGVDQVLLRLLELQDQFPTAPDMA